MLCAAGCANRQGQVTGWRLTVFYIRPKITILICAMLRALSTEVLSMSEFNRRTFLRNSLLVGGGLMLGMPALNLANAAEVQTLTLYSGQHEKPPRPLSMPSPRPPESR